MRGCVCVEVLGEFAIFVVVLTQIIDPRLLFNTV